MPAEGHMKRAAGGLRMSTTSWKAGLLLKARDQVSACSVKGPGPAG